MDSIKKNIFLAFNHGEYMKEERKTMRLVEKKIIETSERELG